MPREPLGPFEEKLLRHLAKKGPSTAASAKATEATIRRVVALELARHVAPTSKQRAAKVELTAEGRARAARLPMERPTAADLYRELVALRERVDELAELIRAALVQAPNGSNPPERFAEALDVTLGDLDCRGRYGGLVPIPELRRALAALRLSREAFDGALLERERAFAIDLKVASDPRLVSDPDLGIRDPGRGLLYFAVRR